MEIYSVYIVTQLSVFYSYSCSGTTDNYSYCGSGDYSGNYGSNRIQKT